MTPEEVPDALVEKAKPILRDLLATEGAFVPQGHPRLDHVARRILAAVLPEIQAQALRDAAGDVAREVGIVWPSQWHSDVAEAASYAAEVLRANARAVREGKPAPYAARLSATTEEPGE